MSATTSTPHPVHRAAARFAERCLRRNGALLPAGGRTWAPEHLDDLGTRLDAAGRTAGQPFTARWAALLRRAQPLVRRLATEVLLVHLLFPTDVRPATKLALLTQTLDPLPKPVALPALVTEALTAGVATTGVAYTRTRLSQLRFVVTMAQALKAERPARRRALLDGAWALRDWLRTLPARGGAPQREALLHLLFPDTFEPIVSLPVKRRIVAAFATDVPTLTDDVDAALIAVRAGLTERHGRGFSFTEPAVAARWRA